MSLPADAGKKVPKNQARNRPRKKAPWICSMTPNAKFRMDTAKTEGVGEMF
jgi:hypothetical protein